MESTPITRAEHDEFRRTIEAKFDVLASENKRQNERLKIVEETTKQISEMNVTLQKQSDNISKMSENISRLANVQEAESARLKELEGRDGKMWQTTVKLVLTGVVGAIVGFILSLIGIQS